MKILVGIPSHRRPELLRECLTSVAAQSGELPPVTVFVADNDAVRQEGVAVVKEMATDYRFPLSTCVVDEPGISAVRNTILQEARRQKVDFIAMIDDDETASAGWLAGLLAMQQLTAADVVGGPIEYAFPPSTPPSVAKSGMFWSPSNRNGPCPPLQDSGNFLVSSRALSASDWPLFDLDFGLTGGGDSEWFTRIARLGFSFAWADHASVRETVPPDRASSRWVLRRAYRCGNASTRASIKHRSWLKMGSSLARSSVVLALAPLMVPVLALPSRRLWLLENWWRAGGKLAAIFGSRYAEYAERHEVKS